MPDWLTTVVPRLRAQGFTAEFYLTLDAIRHRTLTWEQVRWIVGQGMGLGAHDVHHVQLAMLGANRPPASSSVMAYEVVEARRIIEQETGVTVDSMAYVGGGYDATLVAAVRAAGYTSARSVVRGVLQSFDQRFVLRVVRIGVYDDVLDVIRGIVDPALPVFTLRMSGVQPDRAARTTRLANGVGADRPSTQLQSQGNPSSRGGPAATLPPAHPDTMLRWKSRPWP